MPPAFQPQPRFGAAVTSDGVRFSVWSGAARQVWLSLFSHDGENEIERLELEPQGEGVFALHVPGLAAGARYGFRADGDHAPERGLWFDPGKLLMDPYAVAIDRPYAFSPQLAAKRGEGPDTAALMPKAVVTGLPGPLPAAPPLFRPGGLIYELPVRAFTMRHPDIPDAQRGTIAALAHPAIIEHLQKLGVDAVELMPIIAWIDERHLPPLGLRNAWGYNPVSFMALDPRLAPGGIAELRETVSALRQAGIGVILDLVFNHTGESDEFGPTLCLRGLDARAYYRHDPSGKLVNDTGTGNTLACNRPILREMILDTLRYFTRHAGVDGFRFDLAPVLGRSEHGFDGNAELFREIRADAELGDRILIAEPWDIGPGGYQLGQFAPLFLEWNDRYRDDIRRFWRGDEGMTGQLATRLAGSSDVFAGARTRSVNFIAAHDGMTLADLVAYQRKHNDANGEHNRDGHDDNLSWNNGVEGKTSDQTVIARRNRDVRALLATLFASRGTIMLTAGDEFGRTQGGNNNAYAQDNDVTWLDWAGRDSALEDAVAALSALRRSVPSLGEVSFLTGKTSPAHGLADVEWLSESGQPFTEQDWNDPARRRLTMMLDGKDGTRLAVMFNADRRASTFSLPPREGMRWHMVWDGNGKQAHETGSFLVAGRSVVFAREKDRSTSGRIAK